MQITTTMTSITTVSSLPEEDRVELWLAKMSWKDWIGQMGRIPWTALLQPDPDDPSRRRVNQTALDYYIGELGIGSVFHNGMEDDDVAISSWTARQYRELRVRLQETATNYSRPPVLWGSGANGVHGATLTPQPLNLAATFNRTVALQAGQLASRDARAAGMNWLVAPTLGLALEPRWSRVFETFGEDPLVSGEMGAQMVRGIQQPELSTVATQVVPLPSQAAACAQSFLGDSIPIHGHDRTPSWIPVRHLYQYFVPPWQRVVDAGVMSIMAASYTETDGVPMAANHDATNYLLRQRLNFSGVLLLTGDMETLYSWHRVARSSVDATVYALQQASGDMSSLLPSMDPNDFSAGILQGLETKALAPNRIRESARRVLELKEKLHMFDEVIAMENGNLDLVGTDEALALEMVRQSIVLAKNKDNLLPMSSPPSRWNVLVTGPTSNSLVYQTDGWSYQGPSYREDSWFQYGSTVADAFARESAWNVTQICGVDIAGEECEPESLAHVTEAAKQSDVVIVCVGEGSYTKNEGDIRSSLLPEGQYALVQAIASQSNAKIVLVWFGGRPRLLQSMVKQADAVLLAFLPGPSAGDALADIVVGRVNPSARLPITYPRYDNSSPYFLPITDQCSDGPCSVEWPFGHGLSYTTFAYRNATAMGGTDKDLEVSVLVKNSGPVPGADVVMAFTFDEFRRTTPEYKRLRAFTKVFLQPDEETTVSFTIPVADLRFVGPNDDRHFIIDPSMSFRVGIGSNTDCRSDNPAVNNLCIYVNNQTTVAKPHKARPYSAACEAACDIWIHKSSCGSEVGLSMNACLEMCTAVNTFPAEASDLPKDGWGWNYVNCLESVVTGMTRMDLDPRHDPKTKQQQQQCWKMTLMCRDIFSTENLDEFGVGPHASVQGLHSQPPLSYAFALLAGLISSLLVLHALYGRMDRHRVRSSGVDNEESAPYTRLDDDEDTTQPGRSQQLQTIESVSEGTDPANSHL